MKKLMGGLCIAIGILVMTGSGLCSLAVIVSALSGTDGLQLLPMIWLPFLVGGVPALMGFGLFVLGRRLVREAAADEHRPGL